MERHAQNLAAVERPRVLICDDIESVASETLAQRGLSPDVRVGLRDEELCEALAGAKGLIVRSATRVTRELLAHADSLRVIGRAGIGVDNIDCQAATERGIVVMNTPSGNAVTTAEHAIALMCAIARHISRAHRTVRAGSWKKGGLMGTELSGKTLGVIGLGRIGRIVADRAQGLSMKVIAHDPYLAQGESPLPGVPLVALEELLSESDFISLHVPLNEGTRHMLSAERLASIKPGARLINAARGGLIDEKALVEALSSGKLAGAALDVLEREPPPSDDPLLQREDVLITPHLGASSIEAQRNVALQIAEQVADFLTQGIAHNAVNAPAVSAAMLHEIGPYALLAEKIGSFLAQRLEQPVRKLELTLCGELIREQADYLRTALLIGVLRRDMEGGLNFVNAPALAKERGLRVLLDAEEDSPAFTNLIKVRASSRGGSQTRLAAGTVFGREPRLVRIDDVHLDLDLRGPILITRHRDEPGVVGLLGTVLGRHGVNIRRIELGPPEQGLSSGLAAGFLILYDEPPPSVLAELRDLDPIETVELVHP